MNARRAVCAAVLVFGFVPAWAEDAQPPKEIVPTNVVNRSLPRWIRFSGEERLRLEGFTGGGFQADNSDGYLLSRFRFNLAVVPVSWMRFRFQVQDARV